LTNARRACVHRRSSVHIDFVCLANCQLLVSRAFHPI
jgi:hypothetical protein